MTTPVTQNVRIRILLIVNSFPVSAENFLANCQTPPNHELLIPTRPLYSNVLSRGSKIPWAQTRNIDSQPWNT